MGMDPLTLLAVSALTGTGVGLYQGHEQSQEAKAAQKKAKAAADKAASSAEQDFNRLNQAKPNIAALLARAGGGLLPPSTLLSRTVSGAAPAGGAGAPPGATVAPPYRTTKAKNGMYDINQPY